MWRQRRGMLPAPEHSSPWRRTLRPWRRTRALARRVAGTGVTVNCLHPGFVRTSFGANNRGFWGIGIRLGKLFAAISVSRGAETPVYVASAPELEGVTGKYFDKRREREPNAAAGNDADAERLWKESERLA